MGRNQSRRIVTPERAAIVLCAVFGALIAVSVLLPELTSLSTRMRFNNAPPIVYHVFTWKDAAAIPGGRVRYVATYSKRADCHPPRGRGWISYKFARIENGRQNGMTYTVNAVRDASWPAGDNLPGHADAPVPSTLQPGQYLVWGEAVFECRGASELLKAQTPAFRVLIK